MPDRCSIHGCQIPPTLIVRNVKGDPFPVCIAHADQLAAQGYRRTDGAAPGQQSLGADA